MMTNEDTVKKRKKERKERQTCWGRGGESLPNRENSWFFFLRSCSSSEERNEWEEVKNNFFKNVPGGELGGGGVTK